MHEEKPADAHGDWVHLDQRVSPLLAMSLTFSSVAASALVSLRSTNPCACIHRILRVERGTSKRSAAE
eukprot:827578-Prymnesium_polylepis.1